MIPIRLLPAVLMRGAWAIVLVAALTSCRTFDLPARPYAPADGIGLWPNGALEGVVDTGDLTISYAYAVTFEPSRQLYLTGRVRRVRARADSVTLYLHLLDSAGRAMDQSVLYASGYQPPLGIRRPPTFDTTLALPPGGAAIAFSAVVQPSRNRQ